jgi:uncharacterized protein
MTGSNGLAPPHLSPTEQRGLVRRLLDVWGFVPDLAAPHDNVSVTTRDGVRLAGSYLPGPLGTSRPAVLLAHGFAGHRRKPAYAALAQTLAEDAAGLALDLRGHGESGGRSTLGDREVLDVRAGAGWLRRAGHDWVGLVGVSMGATAALRAAGMGPAGLVDAVCAISAPAEFIRDDTPAVQALARTMTSTTWRLLAEAACNVRIARGWGHPAPAVELVGGIAPTPVLVVHGEDDHFFGPDHAERLYAAAATPRTLWIEPPGFGHAEDGLTPAFVARLRAALAGVRDTTAWPELVEVGAAA